MHFMSTINLAPPLCLWWRHSSTASIIVKERWTRVWGTSCSIIEQRKWYNNISVHCRVVQDTLAYMCYQDILFVCHVFTSENYIYTHYVSIYIYILRKYVFILSMVSSTRSDHMNFASRTTLEMPSWQLLWGVCVSIQALPYSATGQDYVIKKKYVQDKLLVLVYKILIVLA